MVRAFMGGKSLDTMMKYVFLDPIKAGSPILRSTDYGLSFNSIFNGFASASIIGVSLDKRIILVAASQQLGYPIIYRSTDYGESFLMVPKETNSGLFRLSPTGKYILQANNPYMSGTMLSKDYGETYNTSIPYSLNRSSIVIILDNGFLRIDNNISTDGGITWNEDTTYNILGNTYYNVFYNYFYRPPQ